MLDSERGKVDFLRSTSMTDTVTSQSPEIPFTDYRRWRLRLGEGGRHTWHYLKAEEECKEWPQTDIDRYWLGLPLVVRMYLQCMQKQANLAHQSSKKLITVKPAEDAFEAARRGFEFVKHIQAPDGHLPGEYSGPMFLLPGMVIGSYASGQWFEEEERLEMIRYLLNRAHPEDGGWGMYVSVAWCFTSLFTEVPDMLKDPRPCWEHHSTIAPFVYSVSTRITQLL